MRASIGLSKTVSPQFEAAIKKFMSVPSNRLARVGTMLDSAPLPPAVQAGVMRMLKNESGVREIGNVTDPLGRRGVALAADEPRRLVSIAGEVVEKDRGYGLQRQLIFDPKTGAYLGEREVLTSPGGRWASQKAGFTTYYWAVRSSGWTNSKPGLPGSLPY
jgi:hypothetical protein